MAYIKCISYYLPEFSLSNAEINEKFPEWSIDKISAKTGIKERRISAKDEFSSDMAFKAAKKLFNEHDVNSDTVDYLILCTQSPDYFLPTTACLLQDRLGLSKNIGAFDFNLGCSGFVYGLAMAKGLIAGGMAKNVLLLTSETYSKFIHPADKSNLTIFGDAAAATFVTADSGFCKIEDFVFGTDGSGGENLIVKQGGLRYNGITEKIDSTDEYGNVGNEKNLYMNGSEIFNFTNEAVPVLINETLKKNSLQKDDVSLFVLHQANKYMLNHLRKKVGIPEGKFYYFLESCGNTVSSTIPIAIYEAKKEGRIADGNKILIAGFGVGYSWAGCILTV